ncbi:MAG: NADH-quinone oxidoreductase subunit C [Planctomycetaceae bacterium]|nr:NADH-quinone oxidoreductase subunit C [Planctomycetaceae bacterium]
MNAEAIRDRLHQPFGPWLVGSDFAAIDPWIEVRSEGLSEIGRYLREDPDLAFDMLHCITAVDYFQPDEKKAAQVEWQPHVELIYHLSSTVHHHRLVLKARLPRWKDDKPGQMPEAPTVSNVWSTAEWHEREVFDLMGVRFVGNRDMRRILCPEDWVGHPLRKDYEMPTEYHGIQAR